MATTSITVNGGELEYTDNTHNDSRHHNDNSKNNTTNSINLNRKVPAHVPGVEIVPAAPHRDLPIVPAAPHPDLPIPPAAGGPIAVPAAIEGPIAVPAAIEGPDAAAPVLERRIVLFHHNEDENKIDNGGNDINNEAEPYRPQGGHRGQDLPLRIPDQIFANAMANIRRGDSSYRPRRSRKDKHHLNLVNVYSPYHDPRDPEQQQK